jgi:hypothetical protein
MHGSQNADLDVPSNVRYGKADMARACHFVR